MRIVNFGWIGHTIRFSKTETIKFKNIFDGPFDLSTDAYLMYFRRFSVRPGLLMKVHSDGSAAGNNVVLTQEELSTILAKEEALLNKRLIAPLSADVNNRDALKKHLIIVFVDFRVRNRRE